MLRGDWEEGYRHARRLAEIAPVSEWHLLRIHSAMATRRFGEALRVAESVDFERGWLRDWSSARTLPGQLYHLLGAYESELEAAELLHGAMPYAAAVTRSRALIALGRLDEHVALLELNLPRLQPGQAAALLSDAADEARTHGHDALARSLVGRALSLRQQDPELRRGETLALARAYRADGRGEQAIEVLATLRSGGSVPADVVLKELALTAAATGDTAAALRLIGMVADSAGADGGWAAFEGARVHAALGNRDEAIRLLRQSRREGSGYYFWMHAGVPEFRTLSGYAPFEELMARRR